MSVTNDTLLQAVADVATRMGAAALRRYRSDMVVRLKADGSPVTDADLDAEHAARRWIESHFPGDAIVGEELGGTPASSGRSWYLDPIDGTKSFVRGVPLWGSMAAVVEDGQVVAGAVRFPALGEIIAAARGLGTHSGGARCRVSDVARVEDALLLTTSARAGDDPIPRPLWRALADRAGLVRTWGDCYGYLLVATGRAEAMYDPRLSPWDAAAVTVIVEEAGGVFTDAHGASDIFSGSAIATNAALADSVREALGALARRGTGR
jgi:histidinol phosphatase-like enzyme (inositol monophosphatase family)